MLPFSPLHLQRLWGHLLAVTWKGVPGLAQPIRCTKPSRNKEESERAYFEGADGIFSVLLIQAAMHCYSLNTAGN